MWRTIRIDEDVYKWLQSLAVPFDDNPNSVLRRVAGFDNEKVQESAEPRMSEAKEGRSNRHHRGRRSPLATGKELLRRWKIPAVQARFHRDGNWYEHLTKFPAAYCDCNGYVLFATDSDLRKSPDIHIGKQVEVRGGIAALPGYRSVNDPVNVGSL